MQQKNYCEVVLVRVTAGRGNHIYHSLTAEGNTFNSNLGNDAMRHDASC